MSNEKNAAPITAAVPAELVPKWAGEFDTFQRWVNKASTWLTGQPSHRNAVCIDAIGRRCSIGAEFMRARDEGTFPIRFFWEFELAPAAPVAAESEGWKANTGTIPVAGDARVEVKFDNDETDIDFARRYYWPLWAAARIVAWRLPTAPLTAPKG